MIRKIPVNAKVMCTDGLAGESISIVVDPETQSVTHIVVQDKTFPNLTEWLVPIERVISSTSKEIKLYCTREELNRMQPFTRQHYLEQEIPDYGYAYSLPHMTAPTNMLNFPIEELNIPEDELVLTRGTNVETMDGYAGQIGELLLDRRTGRITHFTLMQGHLWGKNEIAIPISLIEQVDPDTIYLRADKKVIDNLPSLPVSRPWNEVKATDLDLMVWSFSGMAQAEEAFKVLKSLEKDRQVELLNVAVITKGMDGMVSLRESKEVNTRRGSLGGAITGGLVGLLIGPAGAIIGAASGAAIGKRSSNNVEVGVSKERLKAFQEKMALGSSAIILLVEHRWFETFRQSLSQFEHNFFHQRLTDIESDYLAKPDEEDSPT